MGVFDEAKGKVKEKAGELLNDPDLQREGEAQAAKGAEERKATQARVEAKGHEAKADAHEAMEKAAQSSKD